MNVKNSYRNLSPASFEVEIKKNVFIPMSDGIHLAAGLYRPRTKGSFPVVLVFIPYGKDLEAAYGGPYQRDLWFFAQRGYVGVFVDFKGTGNSEGALPGYWSNQEFQGGRDVIKWTMVQEWCNGGVGMHGLSYGGDVFHPCGCHESKGLTDHLPGHSAVANLYWEHFYPGGVRCAAPYVWIWRNA